MTLLQCPLCKRLQHVSDDDYTKNKEYNAHPYTCGGGCPSHTEMIPVEVVEIVKIDPYLVDAFDLTSGRDWVYQMYKQFGMFSIENLFQMGKEDPNWLKKFRWANACEDTFFDAVIEKNKRRAKRIGIRRLRKDIAWLSLDVGPGIIRDTIK